MILNCQNCDKEFKTFPAWVRKGAGKNCSTKCMAQQRLGKVNYARTPKHNAKMSEILKAKDNTVNRKRFIKMNADKKGKTLEELYPAKAAKLRELHKAQTGENNPNWKGGKHRSKYPYIFYTLRSTVFERDNYCCLNCGMTQTEAQSKDRLGRGLTVHHIDYDKHNNLLSNLATTCKWCNSRANGRRQEWQDHYAKLLG